MSLALAADTFRLDLTPHSALDIGSAVFHGVELAPGRAIPDDGDPRIDRALPGFLFTCGPDHIRHPEPVEGAADGRRYPLHGSLCGHPAEEIAAGDDGVSGRIPVALANGGRAELHRRWHVERAAGRVVLEDRMVNSGGQAWPAFAMYHMNVSSRLFDAGTRLSGAMLPGGSLPWRFGEGELVVICLPAAESAQDGWAEIVLGPIAALGGRSLHVRFRVDTLPYLQIWRNQTPGCAVLGIEPVRHRQAGRAALIAAGEAPELAPGAAVGYGLSFEVR